jgi:hypothetical protein
MLQFSPQVIGLASARSMQVDRDECGAYRQLRGDGRQRRDDDAQEGAFLGKRPRTGTAPDLTHEEQRSGGYRHQK